MKGTVGIVVFTAVVKINEFMELSFGVVVQSGWHIGAVGHNQWGKANQMLHVSIADETNSASKHTGAQQQEGR